MPHSRFPPSCASGESSRGRGDRLSQAEMALMSGSLCQIYSSVAPSATKARQPQLGQLLSQAGIFVF